ncbi:hypothetical protein DEO72_LG10g909 [Vigna unguiculata]|uniref:Uncharacterized protein n=1 Tax=Vigna unguiculata TaxID=3917 RepID=A0A4D6NCQ1_VIGUN|nr:hypothetical protein DEO72_LG10g909 [Vigna unguiculata]
MNEHPNSALPHPIPRSGWGILLRRDVLAQASLPSPRVRWSTQGTSRDLA